MESFCFHMLQGQEFEAGVYMGQKLPKCPGTGQLTTQSVLLVGSEIFNLEMLLETY